MVGVGSNERRCLLILVDGSRFLLFALTPLLEFLADRPFALLSFLRGRAYLKVSLHNLLACYFWLSNLLLSGQWQLSRGRRNFELLTHVHAFQDRRLLIRLAESLILDNHLFALCEVGLQVNLPVLSIFPDWHALSVSNNNILVLYVGCLLSALNYNLRLGHPARIHIRRSLHQRALVRS